MSDARTTPPSFDEMVGLIEKLFRDYLEDVPKSSPEEIDKAWKRYKTLNHLYPAASQPIGAVWVKATPDNLPPNDTTVLVWSSYGYCMIALFLDNRWYSGDETFSVKHFVRKESITHWMPLPDNPNTESPTAARELPADVVDKILKARDALVKGDVDEAYHQLYAIASPHFDKLEPWAEMEAKRPTAAGDGKEAIEMLHWMTENGIVINYDGEIWQTPNNKLLTEAELYTIFKQSK